MLSRNPKAQYAMVELKARVESLATVRDKLTQYAARQIGIFHQIDTYFKVPKGRLKLREIEGLTDAELIYYERENTASPKRTTVFILRIPQPKALKQTFEQIIEIKAVVRKIREIYVYEGVQIHLDTIRDLGLFVEFEYMTSEDSEQQEKDRLRLEKLREKFGISPNQMERFSYSDLI